MDERRRSDEFLLVLVLLAVGKALLTRWLVLGLSDPFISYAMEVAVIVVVLCTVDLLPRARSVWLDLAAYLALVAVMYGNMLYASYFNELADPSMLQMAGQVGSVSDGRSRTVAIAAVVAFAIAAVQVAIVVRTPSSDGFAVARARGLGAYQIASLLRSGEAVAVEAPAARPSAAASSPGAAMQHRIDTLRHADTGQRVPGVEHGAYAGKNVFVIQVESLQALAFGATIDGQEITPNLNRMAGDSWLCTRAYSQTGAGNTADAEFIANTSLLPPPGQAAAVAYAEKELPAIPRLLSRSGYRTFTMHANDAAFWNRVELYPALGFDAYYDRTHIGSEDRMWKGASDERFFAQSEKLLLEEMSYGRPVYAQFVTMSSHQPYNAVPQNRRPVQLPVALRDCEAGRWVGALSYADMATGQFLDWLREKGYYDDSIVIVYGDHKALGNLDLQGADKTIVEQLLGREYSMVDRQHVPLLIHLPGQKVGGTIDTTVGQIDIAPTVADLLGLDLSEVPHLGRSVFTDAEPFVMMRSYFPGGTVLNDRVAYLPGLSVEDGAAVSLEDGTPVAPTAAERSDMKRGAALSVLSEQWVVSLPDRTGADGSVQGVIPASVPRPSGPSGAQTTGTAGGAAPSTGTTGTEKR